MRMPVGAWGMGGYTAAAAWPLRACSRARAPAPTTSPTDPIRTPPWTFLGTSHASRVRTARVRRACRSGTRDTRDACFSATRAARARARARVFCCCWWLRHSSRAVCVTPWPAHTPSHTWHPGHSTDTRRAHTNTATNTALTRTNAGQDQWANQKLTLACTHV